jgi:hypothetical protein
MRITRFLSPWKARSGSLQSRTSHIFLSNFSRD